MATDKDQHLANLLKEYEPGFLPYPIFEQIARLVALPIVEFIPFRMHDDQIEVLLIARPEDDVLWPGLLHTPGTVVRATDIQATKGQLWTPFQRILSEELLDTPVGPHHFVGSQLHASKRGAEQAQLYWIEVIGEPKIGTFYSLADLPADLMDSQRAFITQAAEHYKRFKAPSTSNKLQ
ncbi:MAG: hypothetical protein QFB87_00885 [Patescibacteria group bacterium]|nr:hypothetical protein [Patescibacteria group bacterium]